MPLTPGIRIGVYQIAAQIGVGGMGEVYRATDSNLKRSVAIKVLPASIANDAHRLARFQREAEVLAALNHPNIAQIFGLEKTPDFTALVMELVEGDDLSQRIERGAIPLDDALPIAKQIAEALEAAHQQGIIHRDLKPANIKVRADGTVKVLDFGLAKAIEPTGAMAVSNSMSPTITMPAMTQAGMIIGTAAYMSPEQAKGESADRRADIWAFGAVLYELLTGKQAFQGENVTETLSAVVMKEPAFDALPATTPLAVRNLLRRCLEKNLKRRLQHVGEARISIEDGLSGAAPLESVLAPRKGLLKNIRVAWSVAAVLLVALLFGAFAYFRGTPQGTQAVRFLVSPPDGWSLGQQGVPAVAPDGQRVAFVATNADGATQIWIRSLDTPTVQSLPGTAGASWPFWSPDSTSLGFFAGGKLKKIAVSGGPAITLCDASSGGGGTWNRDEMIVFATVGSGLQKVAASGGVPTAVTVLGEGEVNHRHPIFLADGRHFVYQAVAPGTSSNSGRMWTASLDSAERKAVAVADSSKVVYTQGRLLFLREQTLMTQPFDAQRLEPIGEAFPIADQLQTAEAGLFSASENGVLAYQTQTARAPSQLVWFDRAGKKLGSVGLPAFIENPELSPNGQQVAVDIQDPGTNNRDIYLIDTLRGVSTRLTFDPAVDALPVWAPDGSRIAFYTTRNVGLGNIYQIPSAGGGNEVSVLKSDSSPHSWTPDGSAIIYRAGSPPGLWVLPLIADKKPVLYLRTQFPIRQAHLSPDGRWMAYASEESGSFQIFVQSFPRPDLKRQISTAGGMQPRWRRDSKELFYVAADGKLISVRLKTDQEFEVGFATALFDTPLNGTSYQPVVYHQYDVASDGTRFLLRNPGKEATPALITVVVNWTTGLKNR